jgi:hypothetical protein
MTFSRGAARLRPELVHSSVDAYWVELVSIPLPDCLLAVTIVTIVTHKKGKHLIPPLLSIFLLFLSLFLFFLLRATHRRGVFMRHNATQCVTNWIKRLLEGFQGLFKCYTDATPMLHRCYTDASQCYTNASPMRHSFLDW